MVVQKLHLVIKRKTVKTIQKKMDGITILFVWLKHNIHLVMIKQL